MNKTLPARSEISAEHLWELETVYPEDQAWEADYASLPAMLEELETFAGRLGSNAKTLLEAMSLQDRIGRKLGKIAVYAFLRRDEDTTNATYQALADRAEQLSVRA